MPQKPDYVLTKLHVCTSQQKITLIFTSVRTINLEKLQKNLLTEEVALQLHDINLYGTAKYPKTTATSDVL
jgi:hypothetical protein